MPRSFLTYRCLSAFVYVNTHPSLAAVIVCASVGGWCALPPSIHFCVFGEAVAAVVMLVHYWIALCMREAKPSINSGLSTWSEQRHLLPKISNSTQESSFLPCLANVLMTLGFTQVSVLSFAMYLHFSQIV